MRIAFVISSLAAGGAERVAVNLCNAWQSMGHDVRLITFETPGSVPFYPLAEEIPILQLNLQGASTGILQALSGNASRIRALRSALVEVHADVAVAFMTETAILSALALLGNHLPLVISERIDPRSHPLAPPWRYLRKWIYPRARAIIVQTSPIRDRLAALTGVHARVIANPVRLSEYTSAQNKILDPHTPLQITAIGRLHRQKGFDVLLQAFAELNPAQARLTIYGEGPEREALRTIIGDHGLDARVHLAGITRNVSAVLAATDIFVHPARYEGYPNVVVEALASGCCVLACNDAGGGTRELLGDNRSGLLVAPDDVQALASALGRLLAEDSLRRHYQQQARSAVAHLDLPSIAGLWLDLFQNLSTEQ